ncbi:MAG: SDR family NAD(P)-dependent oxidoreductase [Ectothiorhodospiraceae bacterium]|nr:SDR family NAD(P)-dependent oxidoreductase [Ectothiorhodospiraceae bacterium]
MTTVFPDGTQVLVQGASRGIGLEFVRQLADWSQCARIYASARDPEASEGLCRLRQADPDRVRLLSLDTTDTDSMEQAVQSVRADGAERLHLLLNVAGVLHDNHGMFPEKQLSDVRPETLMRSFQVNAFGPLLVARAFEPLLVHADHAVIANLSARVGSIEDNRLGGWYAYRGAKAARTCSPGGFRWNWAASPVA